jgi:hypothetical protein
VLHPPRPLLGLHTRQHRQHPAAACSAVRPINQLHVSKREQPLGS